MWLEFAFKCSYLGEQDFRCLDDGYDKVLGQLVKMISEASRWTIGSPHPPAAPSPCQATGRSSRRR